MNTSSGLSIFNFNSNKIRVVTINGQPWFVAKDVCKTLNMVSRAGTTPWLVGLDSDEKQRLRRDLLPKLFLGSRAGSLNIVTESGLYKLIMRSDKPEARGFQSWVTREVLPTIRKTGSYSVSKEGTQPPAACDLTVLIAAVVETNRLLQAVLMRELHPVVTLTQSSPITYRDETMRLARDAREEFGLMAYTASDLGKAAYSFCTDNVIKFRKKTTDWGTHAYPAWLFSDASFLRFLMAGNF